MSNRFLIAILFNCACLLPKAAQAQLNIVRNGGFEQYSHCPSGLNQAAYATPWNGLDSTWIPGGSTIEEANCLPDYINGCSIYGASSEPVNGFFYQYPHKGNGMMQVAMYCDTIVGGVVYVHDHLQGKLYSNLIAGQSYCVTFYTVMDNGSAFAINHIGAYFDDGTIDTTSNCTGWQTEYTPQILEPAVISDTLNWIKVQGSFVANGTERFMTIGNFFDTSHTTHVRMKAGWEGLYLIDDVSVIASSATAYAGPDVTAAPGDTAWIGVDSNGDGMPCYWYVAGSTTPVDSGGRIGVRPMDTTTYVVAMDLCGTLTYDTVRVNVHCTGGPAGSFTATPVAGGTVDFAYTGTVSALDSITWSYGDGNNGAGLTPSHAYSATGTYTVCAMVYTNCGSDTVCKSVVVSTEGIKPLTPEGGLSLFPNPTGGQLTITAGYKITDVSIVNIVGQTVYSQSYNAAQVQANVADLPAGIYFVKVNEIVVKRFVKE